MQLLAELSVANLMKGLLLQEAVALLNRDNSGDTKVAKNRVERAVPTRKWGKRCVICKAAK
jgi:hypothetical protein